ncbi:hypothetical protein KDK88_10335 [bacterium]|nr:hypothetical protein [bacterium]
MIHRARILILWSLLALLVAPASAQKSGLEFGFPSGLGLDSIDPGEVEGYDFSWTRREGEDRGLRLGLTLAFEELDGERGVEQDGLNAMQTRSDTKEVSRSLGLRLQKLFLTDDRRGVRGVFGVGPMASYSKNEETTGSSDGSVFNQLYSRTWQVGLAWDLGVEWALVPQVSIGARYGWMFVYRNQSQDSRSEYLDSEVTRRAYVESDGLVLASRGSGELVATIWF